MTPPHFSRRTLASIALAGAAGAAAAAGVLAPWQSQNAEAQDDATVTSHDLPPEYVDPALAGGDPALTGVDPALADAELGLAPPATPVVTPEASLPEPAWEPSDEGIATSLGGSDVAVASQGGSHQIDAPKRKTDKILGKKKRR
jgi:hypothetical protein